MAGSIPGGVFRCHCREIIRPRPGLGKIIVTFVAIFAKRKGTLFQGVFNATEKTIENEYNFEIRDH